MALAETPICDFGRPAPDFSLPSVSGETVALADVIGPKGVLIAFICNHCPYVVKTIDRIVADAAALQDVGIGVAAICANDAKRYPADSFANMKAFAAQHGFGFPYLHDETQSVARAYDAVCTPDFFGYNASGELQYRGRLDSAGSGAPTGGEARELLDAMRGVAETGQGPAAQIASMGCSIKWKPS